MKILFKGQLVTDVCSLSMIDVDAFYGIEYEEFPAQIATVAMWLSDHQMNLKLSTEFGEYFKRLPIKKSATIVMERQCVRNGKKLFQKKSLAIYLVILRLSEHLIKTKGKRKIWHLYSMLDYFVFF